MANLPEKPTWQVEPKTRARARALRRDLTDAERIIWNELRAHRLNGAGFRRQTPIGPYIVDFICHEAKLVVELDGGQHSEQIEADQKRSAFMESHGFRVLRFWNDQVLTDTDGVLEQILAALDEGAHRCSIATVLSKGPSP